MMSSSRMYLALVSSPDSRNFICGNICLKHAGATVYREAGFIHRGSRGGQVNTKTSLGTVQVFRYIHFKDILDQWVVL